MSGLRRSRGEPGDRGGRGLVSARDRFERRAARARRRPRVIASLVVLVLLLSGGLVWLGWFSSLLLVDKVEVRGVPKTQAAAVREAAAVPTGGPIMRVDTGAAGQRLERDRRWKTVSVSRRFPHSVLIEVTPRVAVVAVRMSSESVDLYDRDGVAFQKATSPPDGLPVLTSASGGATPDGIRAALEALGSLDRGLREAVTAVELGSRDRVTLRLVHQGAPKTVVWGGPGDAAVKAELVSVLVNQPGLTIDVAVPSSPVMR